MMNLCNALVCASAALIYSAAACFAVDTVKLQSGKTYEGIFKGFQTDKIVFEFRDGGKEVRFSSREVSTLELDPAVSVRVKPPSGKTLEDIRLKAFRKASFWFDQDGSTLTLDASKIVKIELAPAFKRPTIWTGPASNIVSDFDSELTGLMKTGIVNIVYFHMPDVDADTRYGSYVQALAQQEPGKVNVIPLDVAAWSSPTATKYGIRSVPQFWFYNRRGLLVSKLADFKTTDAIDEAFKAVMK